MNILSRNQSVDVYRGFVMFLMMGEVMEFSRVSAANPDSGFWKFMSFHQSHVPWVGCSLHDMIQPSFSFLVGVVLPMSIAARVGKGFSFNQNLFHTLKRSLILILLGVFLRSMDAKITYWTFEDTLTQIGLGYTFLYLLAYTTNRTQWISLVAILVAYWLAFYLHPLPGAGFNWSTTGTSAADPNNLNGMAAHWNKNTNFAWMFDQWFLNLFKREIPFQNSPGGYSTLSFIPTLGTMILGLLSGNILISNKSQIEKCKQFLIYGIVLLALGIFFDKMGICPNVKRIWTPTWVLFSGGICNLMLAGFYYLVDIKDKASWFTFLKIIGINSIAAYVIAHTLNVFIAKNLPIHLGQNFAKILGDNYEHLVLGVCVLILEWLILRWMYQKKIYIKV